VATLVRILTANVYVGNNYPQKCANKIRDLNPHAAALQEASSAIGTLENTLAGYRFSYNKGCKQGKGTPVLVLKSLDSSGGTGNLLGCDEIPNTKCGKERWISYTVSRLPGGSKRRVVIGSHFDCNVQRDDGTPSGSKMVDKYKTHSARLSELVDGFLKIGWSPIVAADWNYRLKGKIDTPAEAPDWSPYGIARRFGFKYEAKGIDGIMFDPKVYALDHRETIPTSATGSDHEWLMVYLRVK
jgi:hypothetical protein